RQVDIGHVAYGQVLVSDDAEQRYRRHQKAGGNRPPDEDLRKIHSRSVRWCGHSCLPNHRNGRRERLPTSLQLPPRLPPSLLLLKSFFLKSPFLKSPPLRLPPSRLPPSPPLEESPPSPGAALPRT